MYGLLRIDLFQYAHYSLRIIWRQRHICCLINAWRDGRGGRGSRYNLASHGGPQGGPGSDYVAHIFVFIGSVILCRLHKLTLFRPTSRSATEGLSFRFSVKIFSRSALAGAGDGGGGNFCYWGPNPLSMVLLVICKSAKTAVTSALTI